AQSWTFPDGFDTDHLVERFHLFNPGTRDAQVQVAMTLDHDQAEPFQLTVPAGSATSLNVNDEPRVPKGDGHTAVVTSTNGVGVVVERTFEATGPAPRQGSEIVMG